MSDKPKRRWYQFTLRTLLAVTTLLATTLGAWLYCIGPAERQRAEVKRLEGLGGTVFYADAPKDEFWLNRHLRNWLARDYFDSVVEVRLGRTPTKDADLIGLQGLRRLKMLYLNDTLMTDSGLENLQGLARLEVVFLDGTNVSDAGLVHLQGLTQLKWLPLQRTKVTDAGLVHLQKLPQLEGLWLSDTRITDAGIIHIQQLTQLQELDIAGTQITDVGAAQLQKSLPNCHVVRRPQVLYQ